MEFDPVLFKNSRVSLFGKPGIILVPGIGNSLYDWKNNCLIVPLMIQGDNHMASIASGIIEYRLDVDEDKLMLTSYNQLPEMKGIKSTLQLKSHLTKDYITWMTSEYAGYRILVRSAKDWFEHEVAPPKNEIFCPARYSTFNMTAAESKTMLATIEERMAGGLENCTDEELWAGSILFYNQGQFENALKLSIALASRTTAHKMIPYNIGQIATKLHKKQDAIAGFKEFISKNPQSWWSRLAQEHLRRLQMG